MFINKLWQKIIFVKIGKFTPIQEQGPPLNASMEPTCVYSLLNLL